MGGGRDEEQYGRGRRVTAFNIVALIYEKQGESAGTNDDIGCRLREKTGSSGIVKVDVIAGSIWLQHNLRQPRSPSAALKIPSRGLPCPVFLGNRTLYNSLGIKLLPL